MRFVAVLIAVFSVVLGTASISAEPESAIVEMYVGSPNLPDWVAYTNFLIMVQQHERGRDHADVYMGRVLGIDHTTREGTARIESYRSWFDDQSLEIERQLKLEADRVFCTGDWSRMGFDEITQGMDAMDEVREALYDGYYEETLARLSDEERSAFLAYIHTMKENTSYTRQDNRKYYEQRPEAELIKFHMSVCAPDLLEKEMMEGQS